MRTLPEVKELPTRIIDGAPDRPWAYNGGEWESIWDCFFTGLLGFCGCGDPDDIIDKIIEHLRWCDKTITPQERRYDILPRGSYSDPLTLLIAYLCDSRGLTEHGTSIGWPWITDEGRAWLKMLQTYKDEDNADSDS